MLAVIEVGGNQFIVRKGDIIETKKQDAEVKAKITVPALLISDEEGKETKVGTPLVEGSKVELKVLDQTKGEKVRVFKMKSKKRYMRNKGFRPSITQFEVVSVA
ncbi:50S ribosomal protein L21 [Candidatus Gracilibacteria bacterium]|nr:50S ribosomal protein L21 [Candidatus Gracilibacteria bacterium]